MKENFKKLFAVVLAVAMLAAQIVVPTNAAPTYYCSECGTDAVQGNLLRQILPTCGDEGYDIYDCANTECEAGTITVVIDATGVHTGNGVVVPAVPSSCTAAGTVAYETCTGCGAYLLPGTATKLNSIVDAIDPHNYVPTVTPPTCTEGGYTTYVCSVCEDTYVDDEVACLTHHYVDVAGKAATCKEEGYTAHKECDNPGCDAIDPENPKETIAIQNHNLHIDAQRSQAPTCTAPGWNLFVCENDQCPYWEGGNGVKEPLEAEGHKLTPTAAKAATCENAGNHAYWTCSVCNVIYKNADATEAFADLAATVIPATGHTEIAIAYKEATCSEEGARDGIMCVVCKEILHASVKVPANGHTLTPVAAVASTCDTQGNIAHKKCTDCEKLFAAATSDDKTVNYNATPLAANAEKLALREHVKVEREALAPTCTVAGVMVTTCTYDDCDYAVSTGIDPKGHTFTFHPYDAPACEEDGCQAYNECTVCNLLFAANANPADVTIEAVTMNDLTIDGLEHVEVEVPFVAPTYNAKGNAAGTKCSVCSKPLVAANDIAELDEAIKFTYEVTGVKDTTSIAVNSGTITMKIFFEVLADADDLAAYNSEVLANIFGIDFQVSYDKTAFDLKSVDDVNVPFSGNFSSTPKATADSNGLVKISQNADTAAGEEFKKSEGKVLLTTLVFNVKDATAKGNYNFGFAWDVIHPDHDAAQNSETIDTSLSASSIDVEVRTLGDANYSDSFSQADILKITQYIEMAAESETPVDYVAEYDMNKDSFIDGADLSLLRRAIVGDNAYLN